MPQSMPQSMTAAPREPSNDLPTLSELNIQPPSAMPRTPLPPPPLYGDGNATDNMRRWLRAKQWQDLRGREEEKTRQETLKFDRRWIEQSMLADALQAGVPAQMIPQIFAGINRDGNSQSLALEQRRIEQSMLADALHSRVPPHMIPQIFAGINRDGNSQTLDVEQEHLSQQQQASEQPTTFPPPTTSEPRSRPPLSEQQRDFCAMILPQPNSVPSTPTPAAGIGRNLPRPPTWRTSSPRLFSIPHAQALNAVEAPAQTPPSFGTGSVPAWPHPPHIPFEHSVPPRQSQPLAAFNQQQEHMLPSNAKSQLPSEYEASPSRKRKSSSTHPQVPPPPLRSVDSSAASSQSAGSHSLNDQQQIEGSSWEEFYGTADGRPFCTATNAHINSAWSDLMRTGGASGSVKGPWVSGRSNTKIATDPRTPNRKIQPDQSQNLVRSGTNASAPSQHTSPARGRARVRDDDKD